MASCWFLKVRESRGHGHPTSKPHGSMLRFNYENMIRKFTKLEELKKHDEQNRPLKNDMTDSTKSLGSATDYRVAMDFTGARGKVMDDEKEIDALKKVRAKVRLPNRPHSAPCFIPCQTPMSESISHESWFHGRVTRERVLDVLKEEGLEDGLFLVRESSTVQGVFVLTFCLNKKVYHCQLIEDIGEGSRMVIKVANGPAFSNLSEFIHHYQQKPLNGVTLALRRPCPRRNSPQTARKELPEDGIHGASK